MLQVKGISVQCVSQFTCPVGVAAVIWSLGFLHMNIHGILQSEQAAKKIIFSKSLI